VTDPARTARYLGMAGERALGAAAFEDALNHLETALSLMPAAEGEARAMLLAAQGRAFRSLGFWGESLTSWAEAIDALEAMGKGELVGEVCTEMAFQLAWASRWEECLEVAGRGLSALGDASGGHRVALLGV